MSSENQTSTPASLVLGYLALAPSVSLFALDHAGVIKIAPALLAFILLTSGTLQVVAGLQMRKAGLRATSAAFIPLGLFWFSMVGFYQFPAMGIGRAPAPTSMLIYLTMWGMFAALLYLGSFEQNRTLQLVYSMLMICLLLMAVGEIRQNTVFASAAAAAGTVSGLAAFYTGLAHCVNRGLRRNLLPVGRFSPALDAEAEEQLSN